MNYIEITFQCDQPLSEILIAFLAENNFDMFEEIEDGVKAYITSNQFSAEKLDEILKPLNETGNISYSKSLIKDENWNALWESNFEPVTIGDQIYVRAPFHSLKPEIKYEIVIEPKMSFGTGHHATTSLIMEEMLTMDFAKQDVLDMGCGSGILAILAAKMGAKSIVAIDVDEKAITNAMENCERNQSQHVIVQKGDVNMIHGNAFDVILANINRTILLNDLNEYVAALRPDGHLLMSGFMNDDLKMILESAMKFPLSVFSQSEKNQWAMVHFKKSA